MSGGAGLLGRSCLTPPVQPGLHHTALLTWKSPGFDSSQRPTCDTILMASGVPLEYYLPCSFGHLQGFMLSPDCWLDQHELPWGAASLRGV